MTHDDEATVYPFNQENLLKIIGDPVQIEPDISACEICRAIPDVSRLLDIPGREVSYGGYPPAFPEAESLELFCAYRLPNQRRCIFAISPLSSNRASV